MSGVFFTNDPGSPHTNVSSFIPTRQVESSFYSGRIANKDVDDNRLSSLQEALLSDLQPVANDKSSGAFSQDVLTDPNNATRLNAPGVPP